MPPIMDNYHLCRRTICGRESFMSGTISSVRHDDDQIGFSPITSKRSTAQCSAITASTSVEGSTASGCFH